MPSYQKVGRGKKKKKKKKIGQECGWEIIKEHRVRESTGPAHSSQNHLIISELGTEAGYLKGVTSLLSPRLPSLGNKDRRRDVNKG